jgi:DNA-3-methyladenine glycosylase II
MVERLNEESLLKAVQILILRDQHLELIVSRFGPPPLWERKPGFETLIYIILEQQVSLASARSAYVKLLQATQPLTPASFLELSDGELKSIGFSRQKTSYGRNLAAAIIGGSLDLSQLADLDDDQAKEQLLKIKGIGSWTADIYLLMALGRPNIWPGGDLALATAVQGIKGLAARPSLDELNTMSLAWQPFRAIAARILWHYYLSHT